MLRNIILLTIVAMSAIGCTPIQRVGGAIQTATVATTSFVARGLLNGIFEEKEDTAEERQWKQYWRDNPEVNPRMTEAFAKD
ncbi:hypothetical protein [Bythopirellula polymerisocia]|nr:hypothetical protein [Bythopirellula polymerisocia]